MNQLANIEKKVHKDELVEHILVSLPESYETLASIFIYCTKLLDLNELIGILFHDEATKEIQKKKMKHKTLFTRSNLS